MKTLNAILKQEPVFLHNWKEKIDVIGDFEGINLTAEEYKAQVSPYANNEYWLEKKAKMEKAIEEWKAINLLFSSYGKDYYSGDAFVLFEKGGKLFEVNGGDCSCCGLEGQFSPEPTTIEALSFRLTNGTTGTGRYSDNEFATELKTFIGLEK